MIRPLHLGVIGVVALSLSCTATWVYETDVKKFLTAGDLYRARSALKDGSGLENRAVVALEKAQIEHYFGNWEKSNGLFLDAERYADEQLSSRKSNGLVPNTDALQRLEPFELAMAPYYRTFNLIALGRIHEAAEEAAWAGRLLSQATDRELESLSGKNGTRRMELGNNAFFDFLAAMLLEWSGSLEEAYVAYRNSAIAYHREWEATGVEPPRWLACDLTRLGRELDLESELETLRRRFPSLAGCGQHTEGPGENRGTIALFIESGWVPEKRTKTISIPILESDRDLDLADWAEVLAARAGSDWQSNPNVSHVLEVEVPELVSSDPSDVASVVLSVYSLGGKLSGSAVIQSALVEDVGKRAHMTLRARYPEDLASGILKGLLSAEFEPFPEVEGPTDGGMGEMEMVGFSTPTENTSAGWRTLPEKIGLFRIDLPPGTYDLRLEFWDAKKQTIAEDYLERVEVQAGEWSFFNRRLF